MNTEIRCRECKRKLEVEEVYCPGCSCYLGTPIEQPDREFTDETPMPLGKYKGIKLSEVPAEYLIWYRENAKNPHRQLMEYIIDNWKALNLENRRR